MNKTYTTLTLATVLTLASAGSAQALDVSVGLGVSSVPRVAARAIDSAGQTYWRIKNYSDNTIRVESDREIMTLGPDADGQLNRGSSFTITVNGKAFKTTDHVVAFYNDATKVINIGTYRTWSPRIGFGFGMFGSPGWRSGYYGGYRGGIGFGIGGGYRRGGWGYYGGYRRRGLRW